ncbi:MAG: hypothetical protein QOK23_4632 [Gammaproteobacteria bacterium]|jgi:hypothetical protein|nr:hypothetical protein [Gammaproteobacteria bacterium]
MADPKSVNRRRENNRLGRCASQPRYDLSPHQIRFVTVQPAALFALGLGRAWLLLPSPIESGALQARRKRSRGVTKRCRLDRSGAGQRSVVAEQPGQMKNALI